MQWRLALRCSHHLNRAGRRARNLEVAFKTRKIKRKDFKDTKKINTLIVSCFMAIAIKAPLWGILSYSSRDNAIMSRILFILFLLLIPMSCQVCLFCPETMPPLKRSLWKHIFKQPHQKRNHNHERIQFVK